MKTQLPPSIDPYAAERWARHRCDQSPWLHEEVARRMEDRLQWMTLQPSKWVHWEPLRGGIEIQKRLSERYPGAECFMLESSSQRAQRASELIAKPWWNPARWTEQKLQWQAPESPVQMLWANMALHMVANPKALIDQWCQLIEPHGFLMFSCLGPETLGRLRQIHAAHGWPAPTHEFTDMHDWGDMLLGAGFAEPVMDMEYITLTYSNAEALLAELRQLGRNLSVDRFKGLRGKRWRAHWLKAVTEGLCTDPTPGRLSLKFEVVYGHAFKSVPRIGITPQTGISLSDMRAILSQGRAN